VSIAKDGGSKSSVEEIGTEPVHIDFYTLAGLRKLFRRLGVAPIITKHQCKPFESLAPLLGFFLVAKGQKPREIT
jgi:hypothetical protein